MSKSVIKDQLVTYLRKGNPVIRSLKNIPMHKSLVELGYLDSFGTIELVSFIEKKWKITILNSDLTRKKMGSINKMVDLIYNKLS